MVTASADTWQATTEADWMTPTKVNAFRLEIAYHENRTGSIRRALIKASLNEDIYTDMPAPTPALYKVI